MGAGPGLIRAAPIIVAVALLATACIPSAQPVGEAASASPGPRFAHVWLFVMENSGYADVIGNPDAPYLNALANRATLLTRMYAIAHPSLPNYLSLVSGSTHGCTSDDCATGYPGTTVAGQLHAAGRSWAAYIQGMPVRGYTGGDVGGYVEHHDPFAYFSEVTSSAQMSADLHPLDDLLAGLGSPPSFSLVVPDNEHNMHDGLVSLADEWARRYVGAVLASRAFRANGLVVLTWDESQRGDTSGCCVPGVHGGHIATLAIRSGETRGVRDGSPRCSYSVLRSIEDAFGLAPLGASRRVAALPVP